MFHHIKSIGISPIIGNNFDKVKYNKNNIEKWYKRARRNTSKRKERANPRVKNVSGHDPKPASNSTNQSKQPPVTSKTNKNVSKSTCNAEAS